jgi:hypothetical protein
MIKNPKIYIVKSQIGYIVKWTNGKIHNTRNSF